MLSASSLQSIFPLSLSGGSRVIVVGEFNSSTMDCSLLNSSLPVVQSLNSSLSIYNVPPRPHAPFTVQYSHSVAQMTFMNCGWGSDAPGSALVAVNSSVSFIGCAFVNMTATSGATRDARHQSTRYVTQRHNT
jgi:hypothetical protein